MNENGKVYRAAIYVRLSKEDGDSFLSGKNESDSITNQKLLIKKYLEKIPDIEVTAVFEDDGFTGTNFERPGFKRLIEAVNAGTINCVVVKDFSRLGREYLEAGNYIEKVFPALGVRFISINDDYDSLYPKGQTDNLIVPFKNLLNEQYSRDSSSKIRSALSIKRQQGLCVSNYAVFGYKKNPQDKNRLIVDEYAAGVVQDIFQRKLEGLSMTAIAKTLNESGVPTPADYKRSCGVNFRTSFKQAVYSAWAPVTVQRILTNEIYCGIMVQGKRRRKSYKVRIMEEVPKEDWSRIPDTHEAIVSRTVFNEVQKLLQDDTRVCKDDTLSPMAGKLFCADCKGAMVRKPAKYNGKQYLYYVCGNYKHNSQWCRPHRIKAEKLEAAVLASVQGQIGIMLDMDKALDGMDHLVWEQREVKRISLQIEALKAEIQQNQELRLSVYEDLKEGLIIQSEYENLRRGFAERIENAKLAIRRLEEEQSALTDGFKEQQGFLASFRQFKNVEKLDRRLVIALIERVLVVDADHVEVVFRYQNRMESLMEFLISEKILPDGCRKPEGRA